MRISREDPLVDRSTGTSSKGDIRLDWLPDVHEKTKSLWRIAAKPTLRTLNASRLVRNHRFRAHGASRPTRVPHAHASVLQHRPRRVFHGTLRGLPRRARHLLFSSRLPGDAAPRAGARNPRWRSPRRLRPRGSRPRPRVRLRAGHARLRPVTSPSPRANARGRVSRPLG